MALLRIIAGICPLACLTLFLLSIDLPHCKAIFGTNCSVNGNCTQPNERCDTQHVCVCAEGYYDIDISGGSCESKSGLNGTCYNSNGCNVVSSVCKNGFCQCDVNYYEYNSACYAKSGLNGACYNSNGCNVVSSVCNNGLCRCDMNYYEYNLACYANSSLSVQELAVTTVGEDSFQLSWTNPINIAHVSKYQVSWERNQMTPFQDISKTNTSATVSNLTSGAAYTIKVTTFLNDAAIISVSVKRATKPKKPGPINLTRSDVDLDRGTMTIAWSYIGPTNGLDLLFLVELIDTTDSQFIPRSNQSLTTSVTISSNGLKNGYRYNVSITAQSEHFGSSRERSGSYTEIIKTKSKAPNPPTGVVCSDIGDTNIVLNWTKPNVPNGDIIKYIVKTYRYPNNDTPVMENNSTLSSTQFEVVGLDPGSYYRFQVHTVNDLTQEEIGAWSPQPYCQTRVIMPMAPEKLVLINRTSRSFTISWEQPNKVYGELVGYVLKITNMDINTCVVEEFTKCIGCTGVFPNLNIVQPRCGADTTYKNASRADLAQTRNYTGSFNPDTVYKVSVAAVGTDQSGYTANMNVTTLEAVPQKPYDVQVINITATTATIVWNIDGPRPGMVTYTVESTGDSPAERKTFIVSGFSNKVVIMTGLEEYWHYNITVQANTAAGSNQSCIASFKTAVAPAGKVMFSVTKGSDDDMYQTATLSWSLPDILEWNGPINSFYIKQESEVNGTFSKINATTVTILDTNEKYKYMHDFIVQPEKIYRFSFSAFNGLPGIMNSMNYLAPAGPPDNIEREGIMVIPVESFIALSQTSFQIKIIATFFTNTRNGEIQEKGIICCKDLACEKANSTMKPSEIAKLKTYAQAKNIRSDKYKLPVPPVSLTEDETASGTMKKRDSNSVIVYKVGIEKCDDKSDDYLCNGPLDAGISYRIIAFVCTRDDCTLSSSYGPFSTLPGEAVKTNSFGSSMDTLVIVGVVCGTLFLISVVIAVTVVIIRKIRITKRSNESNIGDNYMDLACRTNENPYMSSTSPVYEEI